MEKKYFFFDINGTLTDSAAKALAVLIIIHRRGGTDDESSFWV